VSFEAWDAIGVRESVERMKKEGQAVPANVEKMLESGVETFYKTEDGQKFYYDLVGGGYKPAAEQPGVLILKSVKDRSGVIKTNPGASLIDLGDGVACLEFHSKMNSIGGDTVMMMNAAIDEVEKNFRGLVIGNQGGNFSAGANLMMLLLAAQEEEWDDINMMVAALQKAIMRLRYSSKPVVTAPYGLTLGGGCEIAMHGDRVRAAAETLHGPGRGGCRVDPSRLRDERDDDACDGRGCESPGRGSARVFEKGVRIARNGQGRHVGAGGTCIRIPARRRFDLDERRSSDRGCEAGGY
jgi:3-hydroxyacyl-CoA dehydrogenase